MTACTEHGDSGAGTGRVRAGIVIPPLSAEQTEPTPLPSWKVGEPAEAALLRTGSQLLACSAEKADLVTTYDDMRRLFGSSGAS